LNLFIIGNGFDRAHGLPTSYVDFRNYLEEDNWDYLVSLEAPYDFVPESKRNLVEEYLWKNFENNLSEINEAEIIDGCMSIDMGLEGGDIGIEDTLIDYWEEQYGYIKSLNDYLKSWVEQIDICVPKKTKRIKRKSDDLFISFNYTLLLEKVYKIDKYQILHIHGSIDNDDLQPVIGHGNSGKIREAKEQELEASENFWEKESSIYNALANYYERTLKDVPYYIRIHSSFFKQLNRVDQVFVIGHSFGDVDLPYFKKILESIHVNAVWNIYYYSNEEATEFLYRIKQIGIKNYKLLHSSDFFK
jgi:hypothetical protein